MRFDSDRSQAGGRTSSRYLPGKKGCAPGRKATPIGHGTAAGWYGDRSGTASSRRPRPRAGLLSGSTRAPSEPRGRCEGHPGSGRSPGHERPGGAATRVTRSGRAAGHRPPAAAPGHNRPLSRGTARAQPARVGASHPGVAPGRLSPARHVRPCRERVAVSRRSRRQRSRDLRRPSPDTCGLSAMEWSR